MLDHPLATALIAVLLAVQHARAQNITIKPWGVGVPETPGAWGFSWEGGVAPYSVSIVDWVHQSDAYISVVNTTDTQYSFSWNVNAGIQVAYKVVDSEGTTGFSGPATTVHSLTVTDPSNPLVLGQDATIVFNFGVPPYSFTVKMDGTNDDPFYQQDVPSNDATVPNPVTWKVSDANLTVGDVIAFGYCDAQVCAGRGNFTIVDALPASQTSVSSVSVQSTQSVASTQSVGSESASATESSRTSSSTSSPSQSPGSSSGGGGGHKSHTGAIAGGVVGGIVGLLIIALLVVLLLRRRRAQRLQDDALSRGTSSRHVETGESRLDDSSSGGAQKADSSFPPDTLDNHTQEASQENSHYRAYKGLPVIDD